MTDPRRTLELLDALQELGFDDAAFALLHHFRARGGVESIARQRAYCAKIESFQRGGNNELLQRRLAMVLAAYQGGGFASGRPEVFAALAEAAWRELPCDARADD